MLCSSLFLQDVPLTPLLNLASEDLQLLSLQDDRRHFYDSLSPRRLARFTALTRLELIISIQKEEDIVALGNLPLQELVLINCPAIERKLFTPGCLTGLRKLHIENRKCIAIGNYRARNSLMLDKERDELKSTGAIVFQLDELSQVSGLCNLFVAGMRQGLKKWDAAALPEGTMVSKKASHCCPLHLMKVWSKPRS